MPIRIAIHGAAGRMGQRLVALAAADPEFTVVAAIDAPQHLRLGEDAGVVAGVKAIGVPLAASLNAAADVLVDFSLPAAAEKIIERLPAAENPAGRGNHGIRRGPDGRTPRRGPGNTRALVAEHEPGGQSDDEAGRNGGNRIEGPRRRRGNPRTAPPLQGGRAQRHGPEVRPDDRRRDGPGRPSPRPPGPARQATPRGDRLPRHPRRRRSGPTYDRFRHVRAK